MGFFDDLVLPGEPAPERTAVVRLGPPGEDAGRYTPPVDWYAPVLVPQRAVVGGGPHARVVMTGWSVWPGAVTLHLSVHRRVHWQEADARGQCGLRVGLRFSDGRRVTSLDAPEQRRMTWTDPETGKEVVSATQQATGLIPLDTSLGQPHRSTFRTGVDLYLAELPPPGETRLVVEWPDEGVPETRTAVDASALRAAAAEAVEVWPGLERPDPAGQPRYFTQIEISGPPAFLAPPLSSHQRAALRRQEEARVRYVPRADWERMGFRDWEDAALVRARLDGGAPPDGLPGWRESPLHLTAERGAGEAVAALLEHGAGPDPRDDHGRTPLWHAACAVDETGVRALLAAGADAWTPQTGPWSPGLLLLTTPLAQLVAELPGAEELPAEEAAAFREADALIAAFSTHERRWTEGLGVCFVRDLSEDEVIRRLGADPAECPRADADNAPFDVRDFDAGLHHVGVTRVPGTPGGCVLTQQGYIPGDRALLEAISAGTAAYGIYFNPKGGTFGHLARDGESAGHEEIGLPPFESDPPAHWHFRFWQRGADVAHGADVFAYACAAAGLRLTDGREAVDRRAPRRWVELPPRLRR
ncbi:ankyrin repeat domain-containing protein [Streptomyces sp. NPDC048172]|uniref:ankyrin repeat domain-containing protein n=1 Tax=Streptomyces sp. NPDC048172 TaxID=3365505 RepID=UPI003723F840